MGRYKSVRVVVAIAVVAGVALVTAGRPAAAVETPIYNAPAGGGAITEVTQQFGPFQLDALGGLHSENANVGLVPRPEGAYGLKYAGFDLVDENGQAIGHHDVHLHHFVIGTLNKVDPACPDRQELGIDVQPLVGSGSERTPIIFADPYAVMIDSGDVWGATWHLMNMTDTAKTVYVKYTLGIQPGANLQNTRPLVPFWADSRTCPSGAVWDVPGNGGPGAIETKTQTWAMPFDGYIVGIGGHMHDGGISITTKHGDGTFLCENLATYQSGMIDRISPCPIHDSIAAGEKLSVTSRYDNSAPHEDVMGISVMFLWEGDQGPQPSSTSSTSPAAATSSTARSTAAVAGIQSSSGGTTPTAATSAAVPKFTG